MKKRSTIRIAVALLACVVGKTALSHSGDLDSHFGMGGIKVMPADSAITSSSEPIAVDHDNRIIYGFSNTDDGSFVGAVRANGDVDTTFGAAGRVLLDQQLVDLKVDSRDRIVVLQNDETYSSLGIRVARYLASGAPDPTFGSGGFAQLNFWMEDIEASQLALDEHDNVFVVGTEPSEPSTGNSLILVAKFDAAGLPDVAFGLGGVTTLSLATTEESYGRAIAIDHHGNIVVAGYTLLPTHVTVSDVARLLPTGELDPAFNDSGFVQLDDLAGTASVHYSYADALRIDDADNIVTAGFVGRWSDFSSLLSVRRYLPNGHLDGAFNGGFAKLINADGWTHARHADLLVDARGRIVIAGVVAKDPSSATQLALFRLDADGSRDTSFGAYAGYQFLESHTLGGRITFASGQDVVVSGHVDDGSALTFDEVISYDLPPVMPPDHF